MALGLEGSTNIIATSSLTTKAEDSRIDIIERGMSGLSTELRGSETREKKGAVCSEGVHRS